MNGDNGPPERHVVEIGEDRQPVHQGGHECPKVESVWLVKVRYRSDNAQTVLVAFAEQADAVRHAERALRCPYDDDGHPGLSPALLLGIADVWVEELPVR